MIVAHRVRMVGRPVAASGHGTHASPDVHPAAPAARRRRGRTWHAPARPSGVPSARDAPLLGGTLIGMLEEERGRTAVVEYSNDGEFIRTNWMPDDAPYGYDARVNATLNRMLTSSFTGHRNYMRPLPELMGDAEAMKQFGDTVVVWDFHARKPLQTLKIPTAPLEVRWALDPRHDYAFIEAALSGELWGVFRKEDGTFEAVEVADIGSPKDVPLPVDISISSDDRYLFVDSFNDGTLRIFDIRSPRAPELVLEKKLGPQVNMVSQSWDGKRLYFTSSLLAHWDKKGEDDEQFLKAYDWDGKELKERFVLDFTEAKLGRPHIMRFGSSKLYN